MENEIAETFPVSYFRQKGSIAGPAFKIPFMGPFVRAIYPKFDEYLAQWASGPLSCVSVFHKSVILPPRLIESLLTGHHRFVVLASRDSRYRPQGLQVSLLRSALPSPHYCSRHHASDGLGRSYGQGSRRISPRPSSWACSPTSHWAPICLSRKRSTQTILTSLWPRARRPRESPCRS